MIATTDAICEPVRRSLPHRFHSDLLDQLTTKQVSQWKTLVENAPQAPIETHPSITLHSQEGTGSSAGVLMSSMQGDSVESLAVLLEKRVKLPLLTGVPWRPVLRGLYLVGDGPVARDSWNITTDFIQQILDVAFGELNRDCILFENVLCNSPLRTIINDATQGLPFTWTAPQSRWTLQFPEDPESYWEKFSSKTRYNFRRSMRLLEHELVLTRRERDVETFLRDAELVSRNSWQGKRIGIRIRNDSTSSRRLRCIAKLGALRSYVLRSGDAPIAFLYGTQHNGRFSLEEIGYDQKYARSSPGSVLMLRVLQDLIGDDCPEFLDFGFGDADYKRLFGTDAEDAESILLVRKSLRPRLVTAISNHCGRLERAARSMANRAGVYDRLRRIYRS